MRGISEHKRNLIHNNISNALAIQRYKFGLNFEIAKATHNKIGKKILGSATIESYQNINIGPRFYLSPFLKEFMLSNPSMQAIISTLL